MVEEIIGTTEGYVQCHVHYALSAHLKLNGTKTKLFLFIKKKGEKLDIFENMWNQGITNWTGCCFENKCQFQNFWKQQKVIAESEHTSKEVGEFPFIKNIVYDHSIFNIN